MPDKRKINWENKLAFAQRQLDQNKANIEDTHRGIKAYKASTWSRKSKQNRSKVF